jgi:hypothetical protein
VEIRIATDPNPKNLPYVSPRKALLNACNALVLLSRRLRKDFEEQGKAHEIGAGVGMSMGGGLGTAGVGGAYGGMDGGMDFGYGTGVGATQGGVAEDPYQY